MNGANLTLVNGTIRTMDDDDTVVAAVVVRDGRIVYTGDSATALRFDSREAEVVDLENRTVLPGLVDCHVHLATSSRFAEAVDCRDFFHPEIKSIADILARIRTAADRAPHGAWVVARASPMQESRLSDGRLPTKDELDQVAPDNPSYISFGAHVVVANSRALEVAGVGIDRSDPPGGLIVRDPETGSATGVLRERAKYLVTDRVGGTSPSDLADRILTELRLCAARGVTSVHDVVMTREELQAYQLLDRRGLLPVRVVLLIRVIESAFSPESLLDLGILDGFGSNYLAIGGIKVSIDGGFTGGTAAFSNGDTEGGPSGIVRISQDELDDIIWRYHSIGMRCCVHATGDIAIDMALEAFSKALRRLPRRDHRHRVEHLGNWMMDPVRLQKTKQLGLIAVANPSFLYFLGSNILEKLGKIEGDGAFPFQRMLKKGIVLAFGSDAPAYWPIDPLRDLGASVARVTAAGDAVALSQRLTIPQAIRCATKIPAFTVFREHILGTVECGKRADLVVLGADPYSFPPHDFRSLPVDLTVMDGLVVHRS